MSRELAAWVEQSFGLRARPEARLRLETSSGGQLATAVDPSPEALFNAAEAYSVQESYFNRHPEHLTLLSGWWRRKRQQTAGASITVWSAGCAGGEEAHSVAIALGVPPGPNLRIFGTDMSGRALARAQEARYSSWSLRGATEAFIANHFERESAGQYRLRKPWRGSVSFERESILARAKQLPNQSLDVVLFRNISAYLEPAAVRAIGVEFHRVLRPDGLLLVAPADQQPPGELFTGCHGVSGAYGCTDASIPPPANSEIRGLRQTVNALRVGPIRAALENRETVPPPSGRSGVTGKPLDRALELIAQERWEEARTLLRREVHSTPHDPRLRFWLAVALRGLGDRRAALREATALLLEYSERPEWRELMDATRELRASVF